MITLILHCGDYTVSGNYVPNKGFVSSVKWSRASNDFGSMIVPDTAAETLIYELRRLSAYFDESLDANSNFSYERRISVYKQAA